MLVTTSSFPANVFPHYPYSANVISTNSNNQQICLGLVLGFSHMFLNKYLPRLLL